MKLSTAPKDYSQVDQSRVRSAIAQADDENLKRGRDIVLQPSQRLIMPEETTGDLYRVSIVAGALTVTAL